ncbi:MAG TPA: translation initiation factor IF-2 [Clostridiales bacterium]|nr:translation initiation factor IF-2 [Clostridiales bacterium]
MSTEINVYTTTKKIRENSKELKQNMDALKQDVDKHIKTINKLKQTINNKDLQHIEKQKTQDTKKEAKRNFNLDTEQENKSDIKRSKGHLNKKKAHASKSNKKENRNVDKHSKTKGENRKANAQKKKAEIPERKKAITIGEIVTVKELSEKTGISVSNIIKQLMQLGVMATINQEIDYDTALLVANEFGIDLELKAAKTFEDVLSELDVEDDPKKLVKRAPVVTVMGHVDHGKTSLLDAIRNTTVTEQEAGGITQHIGAYTIKVDNKFVTFLDTPGHEAFTSMRARGAQVTDIAILVVAADDGVMPQTIEAINHAKSANVPIIVAINKIDKPTANPDRIKQQLSEHGLLVEEWGGDVIAVPVSALRRQGIDELLEMILLVAEMEELKANPERPAKGTIIEAELDKGRGPVATILVQNGTLHIGDSIVAGTAYGRVRAMMDDRGRRIKKAGPSVPVEVLGLSEVPEAGDTMYVVKDDKLAKQIAEERQDKEKEAQQKTSTITTLDDLFEQIKEGEIRELNLIIKADVQGSAEAVKQALERLSTDEVRVNTIHSGVGAITESDVMLARASNAIIIGFNVRPVTNAYELAEKEQVDIRTYRVIYDAIQDVEAAMKGLLDPEFKEVVIGRLEVRATFKVSGVGVVAGCYVTDGVIRRNAYVRVVRDGIVIHEGEIASLKRFKDDVKEVASGYECGLSIENFNDIKENDIIEAFVKEKIER